jgi:hypothetical protein
MVPNPIRAPTSAVMTLPIFNDQWPLYRPDTDGLETVLKYHGVGSTDGKTESRIPRTSIFLKRRVRPLSLRASALF